MPYQVLGASSGAAALTIVWTRSAIGRSRAPISAIFASTSASPSPLLAGGRRRSRTSSFIAAFSSAEKVSEALPVAALADRAEPFFVACFSAMAGHLHRRRGRKRHLGGVVLENDWFRTRRFQGVRDSRRFEEHGYVGVLTPG